MVQALGAATSAFRGAERTEIALFWADEDGSETPPGHWLDIAMGVAAERGLDLLQTARLMAMVSVAEADAAIVAWDAKYTYSTWRPITAIPLAESSGNADVTPEQGWKPLLTTPAFPEYVSGHSVFSGAASAALCLFFGDDQATFTAHTDAPDLRGVTRRFGSFSQAADEAGMSRIYGGIHFHFSHLAGAGAGRAAWRPYVFDGFPAGVGDRGLGQHAPEPCAALGGRRWRTCALNAGRASRRWYHACKCGASGRPGTGITNQRWMCGP